MLMKLFNRVKPLAISELKATIATKISINIKLELDARIYRGTSYLDGRVALEEDDEDDEV